MTPICSDCIPEINFARTTLRLYSSEQCNKCKRIGLCVDLDYAKFHIKDTTLEISK